jgi:hypothetical protein
MSWIMGGMVVVFYFFAGNKSKWTWAWAILMNIMWIIYGAMIKEYGLCASSIILGAVAVRNYLKWKEEK